MIRSRAASRVPTARSRHRPRLIAGATLLGAVLVLGPGLPADATSTHPVRTSTHLHPVTPAPAPTTTVVAPADWWW